MTVYCGVDFHARQQTVCYCDTADGVHHLSELEHAGITYAASTPASQAK
jgi:hypothetical protein